MRRHVFRDNRPGANHRAPPNFHTGQKGCIRPNRDPRAHHRPQDFIRVLLAAREAVVGKGRIGSDEYIVFQGDPVPNLDAALYRYPIADQDFVFDKDMIANIAIFANHRPGQNMHKSPDRVSLPICELSTIAFGCLK